MTPKTIAHVVVIMLLLGTALNIAQFRAIEESISTNWRALNSYDSSRLDRYPHAERRYGFFLALGEVAPGSLLVVPPNRPPTPTRLESFQPRIHGLARISGLQHREYDALELGALLDVSNYLVTEGAYESGSYQIAVLDGHAEKLVFLMRNERDILVADVRILPDDVLQELDP